MKNLKNDLSNKIGKRETLFQNNEARISIIIIKNQRNFSRVTLCIVI